MILYTLNRDEEIVGVLSNEGENNFLSSAVMNEELNKLNTLEFEVSSLSPDVEHIQEENFILFQDITEQWKMFIIKEISEVHGEESIKEVYCEDSSQELLDYIFEGEFYNQSFTPTQLITLVLSGTRWQTGEVETVDAELFPQEVKNKSVLETLHLICDTWNLQLRFRIAVVGNKVVGRFVDMKKRIGADIGKRFEYSKDIEKVERRVVSTDLKTAIIPEGGTPPEDEEGDTPVYILRDVLDGEEEAKPPINITDVEWKTPVNPVNKPKGQNYLEIPEATEQWGYKGADGNRKPRFIYYQNTEITNPEDLIYDAYQVLKKDLPTPDKL